MYVFLVPHGVRPGSGVLFARDVSRVLACSSSCCHHVSPSPARVRTCRMSRLLRWILTPHLTRSEINRRPVRIPSRPRAIDSARVAWRRARVAHADSPVRGGGSSRTALCGGFRCDRGCLRAECGVAVARAGVASRGVIQNRAGYDACIVMGLICAADPSLPYL